MNRANLVLRKTSKDSLLLASRLGIPLGYILVVPLIVLNMVVLFIPGVERPPFAVSAFILFGLASVFVCLVLVHRAVKRELRNRAEEPSHFGKVLWRVSLFVIAGASLWLILFLAFFHALLRWTLVDMARAYEIAAVLPLLPLILCGCLLARKDIAALRAAKDILNDAA